MITDNQTLVILTPGFAKDEADSTCLPLQQSLVLSLKKNFPRFTIVIISFQYPYVETKYEWNGINIISLNGRNRTGLPKLLLRYKVYRILKQLYQQHQHIVLLSFWYGECALVAKKFAAKYKLKNFCWLLGQDARPGNAYPAKVKLQSNELIALSDFLQREFEKNYAIQPAQVIPAGINEREFDTAPPEKNIDILAAGSLIPLKQYDIFILLIAAVKKQLPAVKAMLIGDGPEKNKLQALIAMHGLEKNITLAGELSHKETLQKMQQAKIFCHPSSYEGFGVVNIEALYAGCQVISFCKPMNTDLEQWHIVQSKEEMCTTAIQLLQDKDLPYKSQHAFNIDETAKKMIELFSS